MNRVSLPRVKMGVEFLRQCRVAVVDRLHGHILLGIMNRPHVVLDNYYGSFISFLFIRAQDGLFIFICICADLCEM